MTSITDATNGSSSPYNKATEYTYKHFIPFVVLIIVQAIGAINFSNYTWGFSFWNIFNPVFSIIILLISFVLCLPPVAKVLTERIGGWIMIMGQYFEKPNRFIIGLAGTIFLFVIFYIFRSKALAYGDGFTILAFITSEEIFIHRLEIMQVLTILLHRWAYLNLTGPLSLNAEQVFALVNCIGGIIGFWAILRIIFTLDKNTVNRWFLALGTFSSAAVILFFGYIENYTWAWSIGFWSLAFSIGKVTGKNSWWPGILIGIIALGFHIISLPFLLVALLSVLWKNDGCNRLVWRFKLGYIYILAIIVAPVFVYILETYGPDFVFVSLWPHGENDYWFLSVHHIVDLINHALLVAPVGLVLALFSFRIKTIDSASGILVLAFFLNFLIAFWFDPLVGLPRDWDLLSGYGIPLSILGCYLFIRLFQKNKIPSPLLLPVSIIFLAFIIPNLVEKNSPVRAAERVDGWLYNDLHYAPHQTKRIVAWTDILRHEIGREDLAKKYYQRQMESNMASYRAWFNMGELCLNQQKFDSSVIYYRQAINLKPDHAMSWCQLARAEENRGNLNESMSCIRRAAALDSTSDLIETTYGVILMRSGNFSEAMLHLGRAYRLNPESPAANMYSGIGHYYYKNYDSALYFLNASNRFEPGKARVLELLIQIKLELNDFKAAADYLEEYSRAHPDSPKLEAFRQRLGNLLQNK